MALIQQAKQRLFPEATVQGGHLFIFVQCQCQQLQIIERKGLGVQAEKQFS